MRGLTSEFLLCATLETREAPLRLLRSRPDLVQYDSRPPGRRIDGSKRRPNPIQQARPAGFSPVMTPVYGNRVRRTPRPSEGRERKTVYKDSSHHIYQSLNSSKVYKKVRIKRKNMEESQLVKQLQNERIPVREKPLSIDLPGLQDVISLNTKTTLGKANSQLFHHKFVEASKRSPDILIGPEYALQGTRPLTQREVTKLCKVYSQVTKNVPLAIAGTVLWTDETHMYNTALIFCFGEKREQDKTPDDCDAAYAKSLGLEAKARFSMRKYHIGKVSVGIEVCSENGIIAETTKEYVDLGILLACGGDDFTVQHVRKEGYFLRCNGGDASSQVLRMTQNIKMKYR